MGGGSGKKLYQTRMESFSAIQDEAKISMGSDEDDSENHENGLSSFASFS